MELNLLFLSCNNKIANQKYQSEELKIHQMSFLHPQMNNKYNNSLCQKMENKTNLIIVKAHYLKSD